MDFQTTPPQLAIFDSVACSAKFKKALVDVSLPPTVGNRVNPFQRWRTLFAEWQKRNGRSTLDFQEIEVEVHIFSNISRFFH